ncbi:sensor histidine kinase [Vibrio paucivorans]
MRRIYLESLLGLFILFGLSLTAYEVIIYNVYTDYDEVLKELEGEAFQELITNIYVNQGAEQGVQALQNVVDKTDKILTAYAVSDLPDDVRAYFSQSSPDKPIFYDSDYHFWLKLADSPTVYSVLPDESTELRQAISFDDNILWSFIFAGFLLYSVCLIWFLNRRVRQLEQATLQFAEGDLSARAPTQSKYAVGTLNKSFNLMADKISHLITSNRALTNAIAHDLRTPIFRMQWQAEMLLDDELTPAQYKKVTSIVEDTEEMESMVGELLYFAKVERPDAVLDVKRININDTIQMAMNKANTPNGIAVSVNQSEPCYTDIDTSLWARALSNLINNANRYAKSRIEVTVIKQPHKAVIRIEDDGSGIESQHWPFIFDAFYSADSSRNKQHNGFGLGLAIVKQIVERHRGQVSVQQSHLGGAQFDIHLPLSEDET